MSEGHLYAVVAFYRMFLDLQVKYPKIIMKFCVSPLEEKKDKNQFSISKPTISCSLLSINEKNLLLGLAQAKEKRCENTNYLKYSKNHVEWFRKNIQWFQFKFHASTIFHWIRCYLTCTQRHPRNYCKRAAL